MRARVAGAVCCVVAALVLGPLPGAHAADLVGSIQAQLKTAVFHSGELAQRGGAIQAVHLHIQHTINCLEGPKGDHFAPAAGYPCQGQGSGIIPDLRAAAARGVPGARAALQDAAVAWTLAVQALTMQDVTQAQPWAAVISRYLKKAQDDLGG